MSAEGRSATDVVLPVHGGPAVPWETVLATLGHPVSRDELAGALVERGHASVRSDACDMIASAVVRGVLSVSGGGEAVAVSRQSNLNKSVNSATPGNQQSDEPAGETEERIAGKVEEFAKTYPNLVGEPLAQSHGVTIRRDYARVRYEEWTEDQPDEPAFEIQSPARGESVADVSAVEWGEAIQTLLEKYDRTKQTTINLEKGTWRDPGHEEFSVSAENRWFASYQKKYYAQLDGWLREVSGGERPSGGETGAAFEEPRIALITRSASSTPGGERVGPVEHAKHLQESWEPVYHTLRNTLRSEGYELGEDWMYDRRLEPHTGKRGSHGVNEAYAHEHIILAVDGDVSADSLRPVIEKHLEACEWAGEGAHGEEAIEVREPSELTDPAAYVADYCSIDPVELWERSPAYIGWAAAMDAGNIRTMSRSEVAREAAQVDACKQRAESPKAEQEQAHGEAVRRELGSGRTVCAECGCAFGVDQDRTLTAARMGTGPSVVSDGGVVVPDREQELRDRWPSADAAATVGESITRTAQRSAVREWVEESGKSLGEFWATEVGDVPPPDDLTQLVAEIGHPDHDPTEAVGFDDYVPSWHVKSVTVDGEERPASAGNGIEMVAVRNVRGRVSEVLAGEEYADTGMYRCTCGVSAGREDMVSHLGTHGIEEPEMVREFVEPVVR